MVGFGSGAGKREASTSEFWSLVSPWGHSPSETFFNSTNPPHMGDVALARQDVDDVADQY